MAWEPLPGTAESMQPVGASLGHLHRTLGLARPDTLRLLDEHWVALVGVQLAPRCSVESVRHGELVVAVDDAALAEHLRWSARDLIAAANAVCGGSVLESLSVKVRPRSG
jgi:predicted nucleic acid-binding Zn ribbon protein